MRLVLVFLLTFAFVGAHAAAHDYLCGPDEDGCWPAIYRYCVCMPDDGAASQTPYCLDFNTLACVPLSLRPHCPSSDVFKGQATCLAVAFQSEPTPPCQRVTAEFCLQQHIPRCQPDGPASSCRS